jgi:glycosyltransferase involved in cell wall biosynthesis
LTITEHQAPTISVVLTTHNRPILLKRALDSLLMQREFNSFEIIVCADEGTRETKKVVESSLRSQDSFISAPSLQGPSETRNFGIKISTGKWICFLDDDDTFDLDYFKKATTLLNDGYEVNYFNFTEINYSKDEEQSLYERKSLGNISIEQIEVGNFIPINAFFVSRILAQNNLFDSTLRSHEDWDWLIGLKRCGSKFLHHDAFGPNVHLNIISSRNLDSIESGSRVLDYLSIYRKYPVHAEELKVARAAQMEIFGLPIPPEYL